MTKRAYKNFNPNVTPQNVQAHPDQVANEAGGFGFPVSKWQLLDRFLFLGTEGGTYYVQEQQLTRANAQNVIDCINEDGGRVVTRIVEFSGQNRVFRQSTLLFALALASAEGDMQTRVEAYSALPFVARIPTHLFEFVQYRTTFGGWGRGLRKAVSKWYLRYKDADSLAYHVVKYQSRDNWANRDLIRLAHPKPEANDVHNVFRWILGKEIPSAAELPKIIQGFEQAKVATKASEIVKLIVQSGLPREAIPTQFLNDKEVWEALLQSMPMTAMIRNLGKMTEIGLLETGSEATRFVTEQLRDEKHLRASRIHPMALLLAHATYAQGHGFKGSLKWTPLRQILDATDEAFYLAYGNVEPTNKKLCLAIDKSGSMDSEVAGTPLSCRAAAVAQVLITLNVEPDAIVYAFDTSIAEAPISSRQRLNDAVQAVSRGGGTDCSLPMAELTRRNLNRDALVIYTDSETWAGQVHPFQQLAEYRRKVNAKVRMINVAMTATRTSILEQKDLNALELVGLDANVPNIISAFVRGDF